MRRKQIIEENGAKVDELGLTYSVKNSDDEKLIFQNAIKKKMEKIILWLAFTPQTKASASLFPTNGI